MARGRKPNPQKKIEGVELLQLNFEKRGIKYTQVVRNDKAVVYNLMNSDSHSYYEVFNIRHQAGFQLNGYTYAPKERYPNDESFGVYAWTYNNLETAMNKYKLLSE